MKASESGKPDRGIYQVWHDRGWPLRRTDELLDRWPPCRFPEDYDHAANVLAVGLVDALEKTTHAGDPLGEDPFQRWDKRGAVVSFTPPPFRPRHTAAGDVIVDPHGQAHLYFGRGFVAIEAAPRQLIPSPGTQPAGSVTEQSQAHSPGDLIEQRHEPGVGRAEHGVSRGRGITIENSPDGETKRIAEFSEWIDKWRQDAGSGLAEATAEATLREIYWNSRSVSQGLTVPGANVLAAIEQNVDLAGLPAVQREMLRDTRFSFDTSRLDASLPVQKDRIDAALERVVDAGLFEESLRNAKESTHRPWAELSEDDKVGRVIDIARDSGVWKDWWDDLHGTTPGTHVLKTVEREVDYAQLAPWRREGLERLRAQVDAGEFVDEDAHRSSRNDRVSAALRLAELEARIEDFKHLGDEDTNQGRYSRWGDMPEKGKLKEVMQQIRELHLESEVAAYAVAAREVDLRRVSWAQWWEFEGMRREALPKPAGDRAAFDEVVANLPRQWQEDGHGGGVVTWNDLSARARIGYLAEYAAKHDVSFDHFLEASRRTLGMASGQEFTMDDEWELRIEFSGAHRLDYKDHLPYPSVKHPVPSPGELAEQRDAADVGRAEHGPSRGRGR